MLDFIRKNEKRILIAAVITYIVLWIFFFDTEAIWTSVFLPLFIAIGFFIYERILDKSEQARIRYFDLKEFKFHKPFSIDSLGEVFNDEVPDSDFTLPLILTCKIRGEATARSGSPNLRAPLSGTQCIAYRITCGCVKPRDIPARKQASKRTKAGKTIAGFSLFLFTFQESADLRLHEGDDSIPIGGSGIFNFSHVTEKVYSWSNMSELDSVLREKVQNELKLQKISQKDYTGIAIKEQVLYNEERCTVYGICTKTHDGLVVSGNDIVDDPGSLYITTLRDEERKDTIKILSRSRLKRRLVVYPAIVLMLSIAGYSAFKDVYAEQGNVRYQATNHQRKLEIKRNTEKGSDNLSWYFNPDKGDTFTLLTTTDKKDYRVTKDSIIKVANIVEHSADYIAGKDLAISWEGSYWRLAIASDLPQKTKVPYHKDKIYIKNKTDKKFSIRFDQQATAENDTYSWEWTARLGNDSENGTYAIVYLHDKQGKTTGEREVMLETGDTIELSFAGKVIARYFIGYASEVKFQKALGWSFAITDQVSASRHARFYFKNNSDKDYRIEVYNTNEKKKYDTWWDFQANQATASEQGEYLLNGGEDAIVDPGDVIHVTEKNESKIYEGPLSEYKYAKYNFLDREWKIYSEE